MFWSFDDVAWSTSGCSLDRRKSTDRTTVCECDHLTNFAIIFGAGDADDRALSTLSIIFGTISCACILVVIFVQHLIR